jgi:hypothetical protein
MNYRRLFWCGWVVLAVAGLAYAAGAPATQSAPTSQPTVPYADAAFGFELQLPAGWTYDRARFQEYKDSIGLLRGRAPDGQQALQILIFRIQPVLTSRPTDEDPAKVHIPAFEDWAVQFGRELAARANAGTLDWEAWRLPPRAGMILTYASKLGAAQTLTQTHTLCLPFDPSTVWVLVYTGTTHNQTDAQRVRDDFDQVVNSLRVHYDPGEVELMASAYERGSALLTKLRKLAASAKLDETEYYYDFVLGGKPIGYLQRRVAREEHVLTASGAPHEVTAPGLRVRERVWRFAEDGTVRHTRLDLFSSFDLKNELIENEQTQLPAPDVDPQKPLVKTDQVIRKGDVLVSSFRTNADRSLPDPSKPLDVGPVYLDLAWVRLLPGLLLTAPRQAHAFAIYNLETRSMISELITPLGERALEGYAAPTYAFEVREGLIDQPSLLYTDARGNLLRLVAGDLVVKRVERDEVERTYGGRRDEARRRFPMADDQDGR